MNDLPDMMSHMTCEDLLSQLERLSADHADALLAQLPHSCREHLARCANCRQALEDLAQTREALAPLKAALPQPGPWFLSRVMHAIASREAEIEERKNGFWISVRRLAPRLAAFAAVLLAVGGTWAFQLRRAEQQARQTQIRSVESLFDPGPNLPLNDDIVASPNEELRP